MDVLLLFGLGEILARKSTDLIVLGADFDFNLTTPTYWRMSVPTTVPFKRISRDIEMRVLAEVSRESSTTKPGQPNVSIAVGYFSITPFHSNLSR